MRNVCLDIQPFGSEYHRSNQVRANRYHWWLQITYLSDGLCYVCWIVLLRHSSDQHCNLFFKTLQCASLWKASLEQNGTVRCID